MGHAGATRGWQWTLLAVGVGCTSSLGLSSVLHLSRAQFVGGYALVVGLFVFRFLAAHGVHLRTQLGRRWVGGVVGGTLMGLVLVRQVMQQPASARTAGGTLLGELAWLGGVYGSIDAWLLTIVPVMALYGTRTARELGEPGARLRWAGVAMAGSLLVTAAYHAGFAEFRGPAMVQPLVGNALITLVYLLTGSPVAPILAHVLMHGAAVLHGMATAMQLPPHY